MPKIKIDALDAAKAVLAALPAPRAQREWRAVSTALRAVRRIALARRQGLTAQKECGGAFRYLYADTCRAVTGCYNGARGLGSLAMIGHHATLFRQGARLGRVADARYFAEASRREGPVPLPDLRQSVPAALARHAAAYEAERSAKRRGVAGHAYAVLSAARDAAWHDLRAAMAEDGSSLAA